MGLSCDRTIEKRTIHCAFLIRRIGKAMWENWEHRNTRCEPNPHLAHKPELHAQQNVQTSSGNPKEPRRGKFTVQET